jgi:cysteine protease ATG4
MHYQSISDDASRGIATLYSGSKRVYHQNVMQMNRFLDNEESVFSIANIIWVGGTIFQYEAGNWLSPSMAAQILAHINQQMPNKIIDILIFGEGAIYLDKVAANLTERPILIFVSFRLGLNKISELYYEHILSLFKAPCCLGFIGGVPDKAYYFVGMNGDRLLYLDPHYVQVWVS